MAKAFPVQADTISPIKILHTEKQEAERLCFSVRTFQAWRVKGEGPPFIKIGQSVRYDPLAVDAWLTANTRTSTAQGAA